MAVYVKLYLLQAPEIWFSINIVGTHEHTDCSSAVQPLFVPPLTREPLDYHQLGWTTHRWGGWNSLSDWAPLASLSRLLWGLGLSGPQCCSSDWSVSVAAYSWFANNLAILGLEAAVTWVCLDG